MRRNGRRSRSNFASETAQTSKEVRYHKPQPEEGIDLGCVMLSNIRYYIKDPSARVPMRCALGFAIKNDEDLCKCMEASGPESCWQETSGWTVVPLQVDQTPNGDQSSQAAQTSRPQRNGSSNDSRTSPRPNKRRRRKKTSAS